MSNETEQKKKVNYITARIQDEICLKIMFSQNSIIIFLNSIEVNPTFVLNY